MGRRLPLNITEYITKERKKRSKGRKKEKKKKSNKSTLKKKERQTGMDRTIRKTTINFTLHVLDKGVNIMKT